MSDNDVLHDGYQSSVDNTHQSASQHQLVGSTDPAAIDKISNSFLYLHVNDLKAIADPLDELRRNQESLIEALMNENSRFENAKATTSLTEMLNKVSHYHNKLIFIKKEMVSLHEKTSKLKKRAERLQQLKEKEMSSSR